MPTGPDTRSNLDSETGGFTLRQNKTHSFENMVMSYFQGIRPECKTESFFTIGRQKKLVSFNVDGLYLHYNTVFDATGCFCDFCAFQEVRPSLSEQGIQRGSKKREHDTLRRHYMQEKGFNVFEMWECEW